MRYLALGDSISIDDYTGAQCDEDRGRLAKTLALHNEPVFTGIVAAVGEIVAIQPERLVIQTPESFASDVEVGESVAVDGCCLTVVEFGPALAFDLSEETLARTTLGAKQGGDSVNLERAMRLADRLGGHIVQGHVDGVATLESIERHATGVEYGFRVEPEHDRYLIDKGSVAIDGVSLTVVRPTDGRFTVWLIPHTLAETTLGHRKIGDRMNVEFDALAKHVEKLLAFTAR